MASPPGPALTPPPHGRAGMEEAAPLTAPLTARPRPARGWFGIDRAPLCITALSASPAASPRRCGAGMTARPLSPRPAPPAARSSGGRHSHQTRPRRGDGAHRHSSARPSLRPPLTGVPPGPARGPLVWSVRSAAPRAFPLVRARVRVREGEARSRS